jgi:protein TonB
MNINPGGNMDRSMIVSLSIAAALHAGVLFGFGRGPAPKIGKAEPPSPRILLTMQPDEPEPEDTTPKEEKTTASMAALVRSPEPPPRPEPTLFQQKFVPEVESNIPVQSLRDVNLDPTARIGDAARSGLTLKDLDNSPRARVQIPPPYPAEARRTGMSGKVLVEFVVDESGHVVEPRIVNSTDAAFNDTTLRTLLKWRFEPGRKNGRNVRFRMALPLEFSLNDN